MHSVQTEIKAFRFGGSFEQLYGSRKKEKRKHQKTSQNIETCIFIFLSKQHKLVTYQIVEWKKNAEHTNKGYMNG